MPGVRWASEPRFGGMGFRQRQLPTGATNMQSAFVLAHKMLPCEPTEFGGRAMVRDFDIVIIGEWYWTCGGAHGALGRRQRNGI